MCIFNLNLMLTQGKYYIMYSKGGGNMKKKYSDEVIYLSRQTGISKYRCDIVLKECGGDINTAFGILNDISKNKYEKAMDNIASIVRGEKGSIITVMEEGEVIFRLPGVIPVILLLVLDVPSWVIAVILLLFTVFTADVEMKVAQKGEADPVKTMDVEEYDRQNSFAGKILGTTKKGRVSEDGFEEIIIE